ncbi:AAA domain-containing protein [Iningainema tapete]|uniref:AAA family ATPase n=1 Tax=Iningainema tapete BLCC-T55 TaxID=2748662 RepID=A0A8J6XJ48_9CYAN|nr:AAA domain-containing protein [Iningainema tapete]MBD2775448.1 AAA family ATPase [Iningainema tapete BLCC-T55]
MFKQKNHHTNTNQQLKIWQTFLEIEERIAKARQFCVPFLSHNIENNPRRVTFEIKPELATLDGAKQNPLDEDNFWQRIRNAINEEVAICESPPQPRSRREIEKLGNIIDIDENNKIRIKLDNNIVERIAYGRYQLPKKGFIYFEAAGDIHQINQKKKALENLQAGNTKNKYLNKFLFNAATARIPKKTIKLQTQDLLKRDANPDQIAAVETVLSSPDLILIQGPPGTGKTTVIAEICYQVALRGGKTLIASQANLAVDNALSRLVHNPVIRALRRGKAERVQEEGQIFLEDNVIGTWLQNTANDCENNLLKRQENLENIHKLLIPAQQFTEYFQAELEFQQQQQHLQNQKTSLEINCRNKETIYSVAIAQRTEIESLITGLANLLNAAPNINWEAEEVANFLPRLQPYTKGNTVVEHFVANVRKAIHQTNELGFTRPGYGAFGLAVWLQQTVATGISELRTILATCGDVTTAISEVISLVQILEQNSASLEEVKRDYQQILTKQQAIQPKLNNLEKRKSEIDFVITTVKEWKSTAHAKLYKILKNCQQTSELFKDDLVELPAGLWMLARSLNLPLVPKNYKINRINHLPNWAQLRNALSYEVEGGLIDRRGKQYRFSEFLHQSLNQTPIVLSSSDYTHWREIVQKFLNYSQLNQNQRRILIENTHQFLHKMEQVYGASWEPNNIDATLNRIAQELLDSILTNARQCVFPVKTETEQQLQSLREQLNEFKQKEANLKQQISATQYQVETTQQEINLKLSPVINLLQKLSQQENIPEKIRHISNQYLANQSEILQNSPQFFQQVQYWEESVSLIPLISSLEPFSVLQVIQTSLQQELSKLEVEYENARLQLQESRQELATVEQQLKTYIPTSLIKERDWWQQVWAEIPSKFKPDISNSQIYDLEVLHQIKSQFDLGQQELAKEENYLDRYKDFVQDWIAKLRNPSAQDENDLKQIYINNANVIGITCVQAAKGDFSREFPSFDVVIIDEVSKCTPPELLIPALKGQKLVLVGDHRQLPPMLRDDTIEDVAEQVGSTKEELSFIKESLFKIQFESADESIKRMLTIQYRMHPQIMRAINQFYEHKLNCGILEPDKRRAHQLVTKNIQENHHLIWVKTPVGQGFAEQKEGTSRFNVREVDIIERICEQMEAAWLSQVALGEPKKEIGIITFYGAQLRLIKDRIASEKYPSLNIRTGTVDIFQGMERPVIIVSTVCNNTRKDIGFAKEPERVNVAFSRAQELLVVVGCHDLFTQQLGTVGSMYQEVSQVVRSYGGFVDVSNVLC